MESNRKGILYKWYTKVKITSGQQLQIRRKTDDVIAFFLTSLRFRLLLLRDITIAFFSFSLFFCRFCVSCELWTCGRWYTSMLFSNYCCCCYFTLFLLLVRKSVWKMLLLHLLPLIIITIVVASIAAYYC